MNDEILLSDEQLEILNLNSGKHLVLAPPGSGKTELLAHRAALAIERGMSADKMICLTFTNRAAQNMLERLAQKFPNVSIFVGNIHGFCAKFLKENKLFPMLDSLIDDEEARLLMEEAKNNLGINNSLKVEALIAFNGYYNQDKSSHPLNIRAGDNPIASETDVQIAQSKKICDEYENLKKKYSYYDFDDLLISAYNAITSAQESEYKYSKFEWLQIDEAQDLNPLQWAIIKEISAPNAHSLILGDLEQAIFSFMGAKLNVLKIIAKDCEKHSLTANYRSPEYLLDVYNRFAKEHLFPLWSKPPVAKLATAKPAGALKLIKAEGDQEHEAERIVRDYLKKLTAIEGETNAILVKSNKEAELYSSLIQQERIKHFKISGFDLFSRKLIADIMSFLYVHQNRKDKVSWIRIIKLFCKFKDVKSARNLTTEIFNSGMRPSDILDLDFANIKSPLEDLIYHFENKRIVLFDTETTGVNPEIDDIIQYAAMEIVKGKPGKILVTVLKTDKDVGASEHVHHFSQKYIDENGRDRTEALKELLDFIGDDAVIAHNVNFDLPVLLKNAENLNIKIKDRNAYKKFDSLGLAMRLFPKFKSFRLVHLIEVLHLEGENTHDALDDVKATFSLIERLIVESKIKVEIQKELVFKHFHDLQAFKENFRPIVEEVLKLGGNETSFKEVIDLYLKYLKEKLDYHIEDDDLESLNKLMRHFEVKTGRGKFRELLSKHIAIYKQYKESDLIIGDEKVVVATVHKAKGLEFTNVIIPGCIDGAYPFFYSNTAEKKAEDARALYVAMTRAKKRLYISYYTKFKSFKKQPSPFLKCIEGYFAQETI